ncbi:protein of unknown function [Shinella sp. WSC3-e]|nr:hypothetical protein SHINE37_41302 [Rhizobiaceae bacterium]CAK7255938.1 protein of unknown function [Shinella sp. WSC3-e]
MIDFSQSELFANSDVSKHQCEKSNTYCQHNNVHCFRLRRRS